MVQFRTTNPLMNKECPRRSCWWKTAWRMVCWRRLKNRGVGHAGVLEWWLAVMMAVMACVISGLVLIFASLD